MSNKLLQVGEKKIGPGEAVFVIAEGGINHNGSVGRAKQIIAAAAEAGADAVKFQKRDLAEVYQEKVLNNPNQEEQKYQYLIPLLKEFQLPEEAYEELQTYAKEKNIVFLVNPWDRVSANDIERRMDMPLYKIGSPDMTNDELLECVAGFNKPMIVSTGMSTEKEIKHMVQLLRRKRANFALLHCNNVYPAPFDEINLRYMEKLMEYGVPVGYSGHERGVAIPIAAVAREASVVERHLTVNRSLEGPDHKASLEPDEFKNMVEGIRQVEAAMGDGVKRMSRVEAMNREILGKSIVARRFIGDGTKVTRSMLTTKSPAKGLSPQRMDELVGVAVQRDIFAGEVLTEDDLTADTIFSTFNSAGIAWRWGPVVRFHDFEQYLKYDPQVFEFHLSDKDLDEVVPRGNYKQEVVVHAPEYMHRTYLNLAAQDREERQVAVSTLRRSLDVARRLGESFAGQPKLVVHPGGITLQPVVSPKKLLDIFADTLSQLKVDGVEVLPENLPPRPWVFGGEWAGNIFLLGEEIEEFLAATGYKMCFDTSHAALACNAKGASLAGMVKMLKPYIRHLHVADAAGVGDEGLQIGEGCIDWLRLLAPLKGFKGTMVPEIWQGHLHRGRGFLQAMEHLKQYMK